VKEKGRELEHHWNSKHNNQGAKNENTVALPTNQRYKSLQFNKKDDRNGAANYVHRSPKLGRIEAPHEKLKVSNSICSNRAFIENQTRKKITSPSHPTTVFLTVLWPNLKVICWSFVTACKSIQMNKGVAQLISTESGIRIFKQRILILFKFNNYPPLPWAGLSDEVPEKPH
jgi:hypothetical protein